MGLFSRLRQSLTKTREVLAEKVEGLVYGRTTVDESLYEELEEVLIQADVGVETSLGLVARVRERMKAQRLDDPTKLKPILKDELRQIFAGGDDTANLSLDGKPPPL